MFNNYVIYFIGLFLFCRNAIHGLHLYNIENKERVSYHLLLIHSYYCTWAFVIWSCRMTHKNRPNGYVFCFENKNKTHLLTAKHRKSLKTRTSTPRKYVSRACLSQMHIFELPKVLCCRMWPWLWVNFNISSISIICLSIIKIQSSVHELWPKE